MTLDPSAFRLRIDAAFGGMSYPGDERIVACNCWECAEIKSALKGRHWRDLSFESLDHLREALTYLSPQGFRFYLPAFMIYLIMDCYRADIASSVVIGRLTLPCASDVLDVERTLDKIAASPALTERLSSIDWERMKESIAGFNGTDEGEHWFFERVSGFNEAQSKVIRQFLEYMLDAHKEDEGEDAERAIERYWHLF